MIKKIFLILIAALLVYGAFILFVRHGEEVKALKAVIKNLEADSRIAEVLVTDVSYQEDTGKIYTTVKFLEYGVNGKPLTPKYYTFTGNIIQFQSLVIRFDDIHIARRDMLRGKSAYLFWKIFMLDGADTEEYELAKFDEVPDGYKAENVKNEFEAKLWKKFWKYARDAKEASKLGIKNVQIEAPGTMFIPGMLYTIKIEHDGGMRIDSNPLPSILKGETIL